MSKEHVSLRGIAKCMDLVSKFCDCNADFRNFTCVTASPFAIKAFIRGIVHRLSKHSHSKNSFDVNYDIFGLGQISRMKEFRDILLNNNGRKFVEELMESRNAACISNSLLLMHHLSWDIEWRDLLRNMKPSVEEICLKLAVFSMKALLQLISVLREKEQQDMHLAKVQLKEASIKADYLTGHNMSAEDGLKILTLQRYLEV